jgi:hypothetical protein
MPYYKVLKLIYKAIIFLLIFFEGIVLTIKLEIKFVHKLPIIISIEF